MKPEDLELLSAYEANELEGESRARAERMLRDESEAQDVVERLRVLREVIAAPSTLTPAVRERVIDRVLRAEKRKRWLRVGTAVAGVAATALLLLWLRPTPVKVHRTGAGEHLTLQLDRAAALFGENTEVEVQEVAGNTSIRLPRGSGRFVVDRVPGRIFVVETPAADAIVHGTEFDVQVGGDETEVRVVHGEVEVRNDQGSRRLWPHETARAHTGASPRMVDRREPVILHGPAEIEPR